MVDYIKRLSVLDKAFFIRINALPHWNFLDKTMIIIDLWYYFVLLYLMMTGGQWKLFLITIISAIIVNSLILKRIFKKSRVSEYVTDIKVKVIKKPLPAILQQMDNYSFPSGSAAISMASAIVLPKMGLGIAIVGLVMTVVNGLQRLYTGAHLSSEVIGGWITGSMTALFVLLFAGRLV